MLFDFVLKLLEKALNWASSFFLGKTIQKHKDEKAGEAAINEAETKRKKVHRGVIVESDAAASRDRLRKWTRDKAANKPD